MEGGKSCSIERLSFGSSSGSECCGRNHGSHFLALEVADTSVEGQKSTRSWADQPYLSSSVDQMDDHSETVGKEVEKRMGAHCEQNGHEHPPQTGAEDSCRSRETHLHKGRKLALAPPLWRRSAC